MNLDVDPRGNQTTDQGGRSQIVTVVRLTAEELEAFLDSSYVCRRPRELRKLRMRQSRMYKM